MHSLKLRNCFLCEFHADVHVCPFFELTSRLQIFRRRKFWISAADFYDVDFSDFSLKDFRAERKKTWVESPESEDCATWKEKKGKKRFAFVVFRCGVS